MITVRPSAERGSFDFGWLDTKHSFSFGHYQDPKHTRFRTLRVINEDVVAPGQGFDTHAHRDMEILTWILDGALAHKDSSSGSDAKPLRRGELQRMTAGSGIEHSEFNASKSDPVTLLQIWIFPEAKGLPPGYEQKSFADQLAKGGVFTVASPDQRDGSLKIHQDAIVSVAALRPGQKADVALAPGRAAWVQVAGGSLTLSGKPLNQGDGAAVENETILALVAGDSRAEALVFDLA